MSDKDYICVSCGQTSDESDLHSCPRCSEYSCRYCGDEVQTIEKYDENMRLNNEN